MIGKATATVTFNAGTLSQTYDGSVKTVATTTTPSGLTVDPSFTGTPKDAGSYPVTATINDTNYQGSASGTLVILKAAATTSFTSTAPGSLAYNGSYTAAATTTGDGTLTIGASGACSISGGLVTITAGSGTCTVTATTADGTNYSGSSATPQTITAIKATPTVSTWPTASGITYGQALSASTLTGITAPATGTFAFTTPSMTPNAGTYSASVTFTPADTNNYNTVTGSVNVAVAKATPAITFGTAPTATYPSGNFTVSASTTNTDSSALTYSVSTGPCTLVSGATFSPSGTGSCVVQASGAATTNFVAASNTQTVTITAAPYNFIGFLQPVDNAPVLNTGSAGKTYPVKWRLTNPSTGTYISNLTTVTSIQYAPVSCSNLTTDLSSPLDTTATGGTALRYDSTANQFVYNWSAPSQKGCYVLILTLSDGSVHTANFNLGK